MDSKKTLFNTLVILLCSTLSLAQGTITYNLDGGNAHTNPDSYTLSDIATTITIGVYERVNFAYTDVNKDLTYNTGENCQTWSRLTQGSDEDLHIDGDEPHTHYNAATDVTYDEANSAVTWTEFGPEISQEDIDETCSLGANGATKTVNMTDYYSQDGFYLRIKSVERTTIPLEDATKDGYTFDGWYTDANYTNVISEIIDGTTGDIELFAKFTEVTTGIFSASTTVFGLYPNPSNDVIHIDLEIINLTISNSQGTIITKYNSSQNTYDISGLEPGVYFITATDTEGVIYNSNIIKQ